MQGDAAPKQARLAGRAAPTAHLLDGVDLSNVADQGGGGVRVDVVDLACGAEGAAQPQGGRLPGYGAARAAHGARGGDCGGGAAQRRAPISIFASLAASSMQVDTPRPAGGWSGRCSFSRSFRGALDEEKRTGRLHPDGWLQRAERRHRPAPSSRGSVRWCASQVTAPPRYSARMVAPRWRTRGRARATRQGRTLRVVSDDNRE